MKKFLLPLLLLSAMASKGQYFLEQNVFSGDYLEPYDFVEYNGYLYFLGEADGVQTAIYKTNGQVGNVELLTDPEGNIFEGHSIPGVFQDRLYFAAKAVGDETEIWYLDGSQVQKLKDISAPGSASGVGTRFMTELNSLLIFNANEGALASGEELWISDGTEEGTSLLLDIHPDGNGFRGGMYKWNNIVYFIGDDGINGRELWRTDGTVQGTFMVKDMNLSGDGLFTFRPIPYQNRLYFVGLDAESGMELWSTDGTESGTFRIIDLFPGAESGIPFNYQFAVLDDRLYFTGNDPDHDHELFSTDGTAEGTELVIDLIPGDAGSFPGNFIVFNERLYFAAQDPDGGDYKRLWATEGTEANTIEIAPDQDIITPRNMNIFEGQLLFTSQGENFVDLLWQTDGTDAGTQNLMPNDVSGEWYAQYYGLPAIFGGRYFFEAVLDGDADLWSYGSSDINLSTASFQDTLVLEIYPNPAAEFIYINSEEPLIYLRIFDINGKLINTSFLNQTCQYTLSLSGLESGIFILELESASNRGFKKIVLER